jgi:tetratricopeptide (TPR) repeat protein
MSKQLLAVLVLRMLQSPSSEFVTETLGRAQTLYYEAQFKQSIELLLPLDVALQREVERRKEKTDIKFQLALAYIGLGQISDAKSRFAEIFAEDPDYTVDPDPRKFAPKVVSLFDAVKTDQVKRQCETLCAQADRLLGSGDVDALLDLIQSAPSKCSCLDIALDAADRFYELGLNAYKKDDLRTALQSFRTATKFQPEHPLASKYIELTRDGLRSAAERLFVEWRERFNAGNFFLATAIFHELEAGNIEDTASDALNRIRAVYDDQLSSLVPAWRQACSVADVVTMEKIRVRATEILPDSAISHGVSSQMETCVPPDCIPVSDEQALSRLTKRQVGKIPRRLIPSPAPPNFRLIVQVQVRIDAAGNVTPIRADHVDPQIRDIAAAEARGTKFLPAVIGGETRCVDARIPIVLYP